MAHNNVERENLNIVYDKEYIRLNYRRSGNNDERRNLNLTIKDMN
jgi:hypothetical protein